MENIERKLQIRTGEKFKESQFIYEEISALYFHYNPTEGPFIIIPSLDQEDKPANYKLTSESKLATTHANSLQQQSSRTSPA
jgi:hypothetical protein